MLRGLLDRLISDLRKLLPGGARQRGAPSASWQLPAASCVLVITEVIFGASAAWRPSNYLGPLEAGAGGVAPRQSDPAPHERPLHAHEAELEAIVVMIQEEWVREPLWGVPTSAEPSHGDAGPSLTPQVTPHPQQHPLYNLSGVFPTRGCCTHCWYVRQGVSSACPVQVLAENALLARALLEGIGAFGRALGRRYAAGGRLMFTILIPALERLADPCPSVASAASAAVASICLHCGYAGLEELVRTP